MEMETDPELSSSVRSSDSPSTGQSRAPNVPRQTGRSVGDKRGGAPASARTAGPAAGRGTHRTASAQATGEAGADSERREHGDRGAATTPRRLRSGTELRLRAERLDERGLGVAQPAGCTLCVHVADLLPGETARVVVRHVSAQHGGSGPGRAFAEVLRREDASPQRVTPACAGYGRCGGCTLQHLEEAEQLRWKTRELVRHLRQTLGAVVQAPTDSGQSGERDEESGPAPVNPASAASGSGGALPIEPERQPAIEPGVQPAPPIRVAQCVASPSALYYRSRVKLVVSPGPPLTLGSYAPRSHRVVDMAGCRVNARALTAVARTLAGQWSRAGLPVFLDGAARVDAVDGVDGARGRGGLRYVLLREVRSGAIQISLVLGEPLPHERLQPVVEALRAAHPQIESIVLHLNPTHSNTILPEVAPARTPGAAANTGGEAAAEAPEAEETLGRSDADRSLLGPMYLWEELSSEGPSPEGAFGAAGSTDPAEPPQARKMTQEPLRLRVSARSFLQVNRGLAARLYADVARAIELRPDEAILDLYCGVSGLGRTVLRTQPTSRLFGIEWSQSAIADAAASAAADGLGDRAVFFCGGVADRLPEALRELALLKRPYVALLNPPRRGCEPAVLRALLDAEVRPRAIAYVSCSPSSLARDLAILLQAGYRLSAVTPYDMHPGTPHIETLALLHLPEPLESVTPTGAR